MHIDHLLMRGGIRTAAKSVLFALPPNACVACLALPPGSLLAHLRHVLSPAPIHLRERHPEDSGRKEKVGGARAPCFFSSYFVILLLSAPYHPSIGIETAAVATAANGPVCVRARARRVLNEIQQLVNMFNKLSNVQVDGQKLITAFSRFK